jgi:hypothetical protein
MTGYLTNDMSDRLQAAALLAKGLGMFNERMIAAAHREAADVGKKTTSNRERLQEVKQKLAMLRAEPVVSSTNGTDESEPKNTEH